jgi:hypothetical protein
MTEPDETEPTEPTVTDVPEPDQDEDEAQAEEEAAGAEEATAEPVEPEAPQGTSQAEWEDRFKKSERAFAAYTKKVSDIYAEDALDLLPVSISPSAPPGFLYRFDAGRVPDDVKAPILEFFGIVREQDYEADPETNTCRTCQGKGKTKTGSQVAGNETRKCRTCNGFGYVPPPSVSENGAVASGEYHAPIGERVEPVATGDADLWGEPRILPDGRENPNFGKLPQHKVPVDPWGVTAGLTAQDATV